VRKLAGVLGGLIVAVAPFGVHAEAAHAADQTCISIPVVAQTVCIPPNGVPGLPQLPSPPTVPVPPAPGLPQLPSLPQLPALPNLPQLPTPPPLPIPDLPAIPLPSIPSIPQLPGTGTAATAAAPGGVCALPGLAGQLVGQPVETALSGVLGNTGACPGN
jgi:hypothetical protein